jgi:hypothetical protein
MAESDIIDEVSDGAIEGVDSDVVVSFFSPQPTTARTMVSATRATRVVAKYLRILRSPPQVLAAPEVSGCG